MSRPSRLTQECGSPVNRAGGSCLAVWPGAAISRRPSTGVLAGAFWGHLVYIDHGANMKVKGTGVMAYGMVDSTGTTPPPHIEGTCEMDGLACTYTVDVTDNGEPGRNDTFAIKLSNGYEAPPGNLDGTLAGGNIQLHRPCQ